MTDTSRHARLMEADGYWREVVTTFYFSDETPAVGGAILELIPMRRGDPPGLRIQTKDGDVYIVPAYQARLQFLLKQIKPAVGDRVLITYIGEAAKAAPGMNKAKEFTVDIRRQGSPPPGRPDAGETGERAASENGLGAGA